MLHGQRHGRIRLQRAVKVRVLRPCFAESSIPCGGLCVLGLLLLVRLIRGGTLGIPLVVAHISHKRRHRHRIVFIGVELVHRGHAWDLLKPRPIATARCGFSRYRRDHRLHLSFSGFGSTLRLTLLCHRRLDRLRGIAPPLRLWRSSRISLYWRFLARCLVRSIVRWRRLDDIRGIIHDSRLDLLNRLVVAINRDIAVSHLPSVCVHLIS